MTCKIALITGASQGLGLEIARVFARNGYRLVLTARGAEALSEATQELASVTEVAAIPGDVADMDHADRLVNTALERFGHVDVLINNASTLGPTPMPELENYPIDALAEVFRVNALAPLHLAQLVLPGMRSRGSGLVVNVTSDAGVEAYPTWGGYGGSKAALEHLSRVMSAELEGSGVRVYIVDPGDMNTEMHRQAEPGVDLSELPLPEVSAPAFLTLARDINAPSGRFHALELVEREVTHAGT